MSWPHPKLSRVCTIAEGQVDPTQEPFASMHLVAPNHIESGTGLLSGVETAGEQGAISGKYLCLPGDVIYSKIRPALRKAALAVEPCLTSADMYPLRPATGMDGRYLKYYLLSDEFSYETALASDRVAMPKINREALNEIRVPKPSEQEQRAIADFLDAETARIDAVIAKKQRMVDLLKDRLNACIRRAISEGLTSPELRETDVAVVPRLPIHWELTRARFVCRVETGAGDTVQATEDGDFPFFVRSDTVEHSDRFLFDTEAVLTAGDGAGVAKVFHHYSGKFNAHQRVYVMHDFRRVLGRYYYYCLRTLFPLVALDGSAKSTVDSVRRHMLTDMPVPLPPLEEQAQIVRALDQEVARADSMLGVLEKQLELLKEHRQALITAAVTGELEVPGVAT